MCMWAVIIPNGQHPQQNAYFRHVNRMNQSLRNYSNDIFCVIWWWTAILITDIKNHVYLKNPPNHVNRTLLRQPTTNDAVCIFDSTRTLTHLISLCPMPPFPIACARKQSAAPVHPCAHKKSSMLLKRTRRYQLTKSDSARITYGSVSTVVRCPPSIKTSKKVTSTGVTLVCWYCQQENM